MNTAREYLQNHQNDTYGTDTLEVNSTLSLAQFPFGVNRGPGDHRNALGMGRNSTLLNALFSTGAISSRTYSYWAGWTGPEAQYQKDGNLILGGYDAAKISGGNITLPLTHNDEHCPEGYVVTISDIRLNLLDGSSPSILGTSAGSALRACVNPSMPVIILSENIWNSFVAESGVTQISSPPNTGYSLRYGFFGMLIDIKGS